MDKNKSISTFFYKNLSASSQKSQFVRRSINIGTFVISIGILFLLVGFFTIQGFFTSLDNRIRDFAGDIYIYKGGFGEDKKVFDNSDSEDILSKINQNKCIYRKNVSFPCIISHNLNNHGMLILGTSDINAFIKKYITNGILPESKKGQVAISEFWKNKLKVDIGDSITFYTFSKIPKTSVLQICAIFKTSLPDFDEKFAIVDLYTAYSLNRDYKDKIQSITVNFKNKNESETLIASIAQCLPHDFSIKTARSELADIYEWIEVLQQNVYLFMVILLTVILSTMLGIYTIIFVDKLFTIDLMKIIGVTTWDISKIFLKMTSKMLIYGLILGNSMSFLYIALSTTLFKINLDPSVHYIDHLPIQFSLKFFLIVNFSIVSISIAAWLLASFFIRYMKIDTSKYR